MVEIPARSPCHLPALDTSCSAPHITSRRVFHVRCFRRLHSMGGRIFDYLRLVLLARARLYPNNLHNHAGRLNHATTLSLTQHEGLSCKSSVDDSRIAHFRISYEVVAKGAISRSSAMTFETAPISKLVYPKILKSKEEWYFADQIPYVYRVTLISLIFYTATPKW